MRKWLVVLIFVQFLMTSCGKDKKETLVSQMTSGEASAPTEQAEGAEQTTLTPEEQLIDDMQIACLNMRSTEISLLFWHFCPNIADISISDGMSTLQRDAFLLGSKWSYGPNNNFGISFDGRTDQYVLSDSNWDSSLTRGFTISSWVKIKGTEGVIVSKLYEVPDSVRDVIDQDPYVVSLRNQLFNLGGRLNYKDILKIYQSKNPTFHGYMFGFNNEGHLTFSISNHSVTVPVSIPYDTWSHVAVSWDANAAKFYINGDLVSTQQLDYDFWPAQTTNLYIGINNFSGMSPFNGVISDLKIFRRARTEEEICNDTGLTTCIAAQPEPEPTPQPEPTPEPSAPQIIGTAPPVAWYLCAPETGTTAADCSGNNNDGTIYNAGWVSGPNNSLGAIEFTGTSDSYIGSSHTTLLDITGPLTITAWIKLKSIGGTEMIVAKHRNSIGYELFLDNGKLRLALYGSGVGSTAEIIPQVWTHVAVTWDGTEAKFYLNGQLNSSYPYTPVLESNDFPLAIGSWPGGNVYSFNGFMSDVRIYNYERMPEQICSDSGLTTCP